MNRPASAPGRPSLGSSPQRFTIDELWHFAGVCRVAAVMPPYLEVLVTWSGRDERRRVGATASSESSEGDRFHF